MAISFDAGIDVSNFAVFVNYIGYALSVATASFHAISFDNAAIHICQQGERQIKLFSKFLVRRLIIFTDTSTTIPLF